MVTAASNISSSLWMLCRFQPSLCNPFLFTLMEQVLVVSQYVLDEASGGDPILASERMQALAGIPLLPNAPQIMQIANEIMTRAILPPKAQVDALHIATVAHHRIQYLLTWNCKHIANAKILPRIHQVLIDAGVPIPVICTPEELLGNDSEIDD